MNSFVTMHGINSVDTKFLRLIYIISYFFLSHSDLFLPTHCRCEGLPLHLITLRHTTLGKKTLDEGSASHRDLHLTTHHLQQKHIHHTWRDSNPQSQQASDRRPTATGVDVYNFNNWVDQVRRTTAIVIYYLSISYNTKQCIILKRNLICTSAVYWVIKLLSRFDKGINVLHRHDVPVRLTHLTLHTSDMYI